MEDPGIDPGTSRMLSERSTIWASPPYYSVQEWQKYTNKAEEFQNVKSLDTA